MGSGVAVSEIGVKKTYVHFYDLFAQYIKGNNVTSATIRGLLCSECKEG
jgi:hypothetical protein